MMSASHPLPTRLFPPLPPTAQFSLGGRAGERVTQAFIETHTVPTTRKVAHPFTAHMISAQLPHPPSQDLPDGLLWLPHPITPSQLSPHRM